MIDGIKRPLHVLEFLEVTNWPVGTKTSRKAQGELLFGFISNDLKVSYIASSGIVDATDGFVKPHQQPSQIMILQWGGMIASRMEGTRMAKKASLAFSFAAAKPVDCRFELAVHADLKIIALGIISAGLNWGINCTFITGCSRTINQDNFP